MATQSQIRIDVNFACAHEQRCRAVYERQNRRIQRLCQWMAADIRQGRELAVRVFAEACGGPDAAGDDRPANPERLAEALALEFRGLFHGVSPAAGPRLVARDPAAGAPVQAALAALPPSHRLLYLLHELEGCAPQKIAGWLQISASDCARIIHEARLQMRRMLLSAA
ncbi:MAG: hypothetical protein ACRD01_15820 [Terriglobales bacterium]